MGDVRDPEILADRARDLEADGLNGFDLVFVELDEAADPPAARLTAEFVNALALEQIVNRHLNDGVPANQLFEIAGGVRRRGGDLPGDVQVRAIAAAPGPALALTVSPIGDYATYRLTALHPAMDPQFDTIPFKFRPGCFNLNCRPAPSIDAPADEPRIDYTARDFHSFKHLLLNAMAERVPDWSPTNDADLDNVLIELIAARGDEIADKQDRAMNEAYFPRARRRTSLARHARLVDYHVHQGNQASTWLALQVTGQPDLPPGWACWTGRGKEAPEETAEVFLHDVRDLAPGEARTLREELNALTLHTWSGLVTALDKGATEADLTTPGIAMTETQATDLLDLILNDTPGPLLIEERLNPETGREAGRDPRARQTLRVVGGRIRRDPSAGAWMVRVRWRPEDALTRRYEFVSRPAGSPLVEDVSMFFGNLVPVAHGCPNLTLFTDPARPMDAALAAGLQAGRSAFALAYPWGRITEASYRETDWGRLCPLPEGPLAFRETPTGGETPPLSTLAVRVEGISDWAERIDFIASRSDAEHFMVEVEADGRAAIRFGRAPNGAAPPDGAFVAARYQTGEGPDGNVGADRIAAYDAASNPAILEIWNPFDVTGGRLAEPAGSIKRRAPEAYRARQLRAVTLADYVDRAEELSFVRRAAAAYGWTGSWRTVTVTLDPEGATELTPAQTAEAAAHLNAVRLIGEDLEIRPPDFVPLDVRLVVCAAPRFWREDLAAELEEAFSEGYDRRGERGFFHPDLWTFGQSLHASQIVGRALRVAGVDRVLEVGMRRWDRAGGPSTDVITVNPEDLPVPEEARMDVGPNQIVRVANDPDALELGRMTIEVRGGRR